MKYEIVVAAEPFAFGPASKAITIATDLAKSGYRVCLWVQGTALTLAQASTSLSVFDASRCDLSDLLLPDGQASRTVISVMDRPALEAGLCFGAKTVWIDTLGWWWPEPLTLPDEVDLFIEQRSLGRNDQRDRLTVPPITGIGDLVRTAEPSDPARVVAVNFGGMQAQGWYEPGKDYRSHEWIAEMVAELAGDLGWNEVHVTGNSEYLDSSALAGKDWLASACTLSHDDILKLLARADLLLTVPGLETPLEAWSLGTPTAFLPPTNSSQYFQL